MKKIALVLALGIATLWFTPARAGVAFCVNGWCGGGYGGGWGGYNAYPYYGQGRGYYYGPQYYNPYWGGRSYYRGGYYGRRHGYRYGY